MAGFKTWFGAGRNRSRSHPFGVFFWIFLVLTIFLVGFGLNNLVRDFRTRSWPSVACEILESKVVPAGEATRFVPWLRYRYEYGGHIRLSDRIHREAEVSRETYADAEAALAAYPVGGHRTCRVNPADPSEAILETNFDFAIFVVSPFCML